MQAGRELVAQAQKVAEGELKVSMPLILGRLVVPELGRLSARHPRLSFNLSLTDRFTRMAEEGVDVAVRIGELEDSSLVSRTLRVPQWVTVASPAYLGRGGTPRHYKELERHACLKFVTPSGHLARVDVPGHAARPAPHGAHAGLVPHRPRRAAGGGARWRGSASARPSTSW